MSLFIVGTVDGVTIIDAVGRLSVRATSLSDTVPTLDALKRTSFRSLSTSDLNNTLDNAIWSHNINIVNVTDTVTVSQNISQIVMGATLDGLSLGSTSFAGGSYNITINTPGDSVIRQINLGRNIIDTSIHGDVSSRNGTFILKTNETISTIDSLAVGRISLRQLNETNTTADLLTKAYIRNANTVDSLVTNDSLTGTASTDYYRTLLTTLVTSDGISKLQNVNRSTNESVHTSDSLLNIGAYVRFLSESPVNFGIAKPPFLLSSSLLGSLGSNQQIPDIVTRQMGFVRLPVDTISVADLLARLIVTNKSIADNLPTVNDSLARNDLSSRSTIETSSVLDTIDRRLGLSRNINEQLNTLRLNSPLPGAFLLGGFSTGQGGGVGDSLSRTYFAYRNSSDNIVLYDNVTRTAILYSSFKVDTVSTAGFAGVRIVTASLPLAFNSNWYAFAVSVIPEPLQWSANSILTINTIADPIRPDVNRHQSRAFITGHKVRNS